MQEKGDNKAGHQVRLLDIPATDYSHGAFNNIHEFEDGRAFSDELKSLTTKYYGVAGKEFIKKIIESDINLPKRYAEYCKLTDFKTNDGLEARAAVVLSLIALAGDLATEFGITGWDTDEATPASVLAFSAWRDNRGHGKTEDNQILTKINDFILRYGDSRFTQLPNDISGNDSYQMQVNDRAGWWKIVDNDRIYIFTPQALQEAAKGFDQRKILDALENSKWLFESDKGQRRSKSIRINGSKKNLYCIRPLE